MGSEFSIFYRYNLKRIARSLTNELIGETINWFTIFRKGQELQELSKAALKGDTKQRQEYMKSKYEEE